MAERKQKINIVHVSGKRKSATARVTLKAGKGIIKINNFSIENYKPEVAKMRILEPIFLAGETAKKVDININVYGGGWNGQTDACRTGIGKALVQFQPSLKKTFLDYDRALVVSDIRHTEASKPNDSKPRKTRQKSYR